MLERALHYSHKLLKEVLDQGDFAVDATMGNGNDTVFLARLVGKEGQVHAFDVQDQALANTRKKLEEAGLSAHLHLEGHENVEKYLHHDLKAAIFNLGYLPSGINNHRITTQSPVYGR